MHANGCQVQFLNDHWERMLYASEILHISFPDYFTFEFLNKQIAGLLTRLKLFQAVRIKVSVIRKAEGYYIPDSMECEILIEASYLGKGPYEIMDKSLILGVFEEAPKPKAEYLKVKTMNAMPYILAGIYARKNHYNDALLVDDRGFIVEATSSNLFAVEGKNLLTPSLEIGCVQGIMRKQLIKIANQLNYKVDENTYLTKADLLKMDELFLTNAVSGIRSVTAYQNRRYFKKNAQKMMVELNRVAFTNSLAHNE
jgi:branched-chain amino acid aminotransferase